MFRKREPLPGISRALLSVLTLVLIITTIPALYLLPAEVILYQPRAYVRALDNQQFARRFPELLSESFVNLNSRPAVPGISPRAAAFLEQEGLEQIFAQIFPESWVRSQSTSVLAGAGAYLNFQSERLALPVDFREVKARLASEPGQQVARQVVNSWPACTEEDAARLAMQAAAEQLTEIPLCRLPEPASGLVLQMFSAAMNQMAGALPDALDLAGPLYQDETSGIDRIQPVYNVYAVLRWVFRFLPIVALSVLLWIVLLTLRSLPDLLYATGQPLFTAGLITLASAVLLAILVNPLYWRLATGAIPALPDPFQVVLRQAMVEVGNRFAIWSGFAGFAALVIGFLMTFLSKYVESP